jgi:chromate transporter
MATDLSDAPDAAAGRGRLLEIASAFGRLGVTAFGGPAAHLAIFRDEFIARRRWIDDARFADLLGAANLLPGPTSTEVALGIGYVRAGRPGMLAAGAMFILPSALLVLAFAVVYQAAGSLPETSWVLYGIQPAVVMVVARAILALAPTVLKEAIAWVIAGAAAAAGLIGLHPLVPLGAGAIAMVAIRAARRPFGAEPGVQALMPPVAFGGALPAAAGAAGMTLASLFLTFLAIGVVSFGSGYLLLAFLREAFVVPGLITDRQLLDAVAISQVTPGPLFTAATFIGYLLAGLPGAVLATVGIFAPAFALVAVTHGWLPRLRASRVASAALDGVNAAAVGLLVAVTAQLAREAIRDVGTFAIAVVAGLSLVTGRVGVVSVLIGSALAGWLLNATGLVP